MASPWILPQATRPPGRCQLWCLPYAGGGASAFHGWAAALTPVAQVFPIQLPGRENRLAEPPFVDWPELIASLADAVGPELEPPYALFGHSFGGLLAFELARRFHWEGRPAPKVLFVGACNPPDRANRRRSELHKLADRELIQEVLRFGGTPAAVFEQPELRELLLPPLRADFQLFETYQPPRGEPLECPIIAYCGSDDHEAPPAAATEWRRQTRGRFTQRNFAGGHFFLKTARPALLAALKADLSALLPAGL